MKQLFTDIVAQADIGVDGARDWDMHVHEEAFYKRVVTGGSLALGMLFIVGVARRRRA